MNKIEKLIVALLVLGLVVLVLFILTLIHTFALVIELNHLVSAYVE